jgi:hypothetical protein
MHGLLQNVGMKLEPDGRPGPAAADEDSRDGKAVRGGVREDVPRAAGRGFVESAKDVPGSMGQRQSHDRAAGLRVLVGRAVPLPVVADNQPFSSRGNEGGFLVQHLVDVDSPPLGLGLFPTSEMAAIPVENRAGRRLAGLDRVQPLDRGVGVTAGSSRAEDPGARPRQVAGARSHDHGDVAGTRGSQAEHPEVGVDSPLGHGSSGIKTQVQGRRRIEPCLSLAERDDPVGPLARQVAKPHGCHQSKGPAAVGPGVVPLDRDMIQREGPLAGQAPNGPKK